LAGAGLPTDAFIFAGFLPNKKTARQKAIAELKTVAATLVFYESPQRLADTLSDLAETLGNRDAAVARELTKLFEETRRGTLKELAAFYATEDVKGEIVILVGAGNDAAAVAPDIEALLRQALKTETLRDAVTAVSGMTGIKKSEVYARALKMKG
jgi:16S rRNA (cytidine1402-2'-O)-methyltransferase